MNEQQNEEFAAEQLIENAQQAQEEAAAEVATAVKTDAVEQTEAEGKIFKKYKIKDIVFLAIITACTLVTSAFMPLLVNVPCYGIIQMGLGLQFSLFPVIGIMKVRKPGALLFQSVFMAIFLVFMFPPMAFIAVCGLAAEFLTLIIFRGYKNDWACVFAGTLYMPMTLPFMYLYYNVMYTAGEDTKAAIKMYIGGNASAGVIAGIVVAVIAICFVGSVLGMVISRELRKAGVLKN